MPHSSCPPARSSSPLATLAELQMLTAALARTRSCSEVADVVIDRAMPALGAEVGVLAILTEDGKALRNVGFKGVDDATEGAWQEYSIESPVPVAEAALTRRAIIVETVEERDRRYPVLAQVHGIAQGGAVTTFPLFAESKLLGVLGLCFPTAREFSSEDLTFLQTLADQCALAVERAQLLEAMEESARRKDEFLAMLAHELRNPLAPIRHATALLQKSHPRESEEGRMVAIIERQSRHMARIVDDLLDVSRITRGKLELSRTECDLVALVRSTVEDHLGKLAAHELTLELQLPDQPVRLLADATRIVQMLANLLHNSAKFTPPGGHVRIGLRREQESCELWVEDDGVGMDAAMLQRAFEPFTQADRTLSRSEGGLGLGLSLVRGLSRLHGGDASLESAGPGRGSCVRIHLPLGAPSLATQAAELHEAVQRRILVVEDNEDAREMLCLLLARGGHDVWTASDGAEGLEIAQRERPDVVLSDLGLPGALDGYALARALRSDARTSSCHLIALSGYGGQSVREQALAAGFTAHLTKPADVAELERLIAASQPQDQPARPC